VTNFSHFGDKTFVQTFQNAADAVGGARVKDYETLDRRLMSQEAPAAPLINPRWFDFVSARVGGYVYSQAYGIDYDTLFIKK
jgi:hypothetical protein